MPHQPIVEQDYDEAAKERQDRFAQDRDSEVHTNVLQNKFKGKTNQKREETKQLQEVKEEGYSERETETQKYTDGNFSGQMEDFGTPEKVHEMEIEGGGHFNEDEGEENEYETEVIEQEIPSSDLLEDCMLLFTSCY